MAPRQPGPPGSISQYDRVAGSSQLEDLGDSGSGQFEDLGDSGPGKPRRGSIPQPSVSTPSGGRHAGYPAPPITKPRRGFTRQGGLMSNPVGVHKCVGAYRTQRSPPGGGQHWALRWNRFAVMWVSRRRCNVTGCRAGSAGIRIHAATSTNIKPRRGSIPQPSVSTPTGGRHAGYPATPPPQNPEGVSPAKMA